VVERRAEGDEVGVDRRERVPAALVMLCSAEGLGVCVEEIVERGERVGLCMEAVVVGVDVPWPWSEVVVGVEEGRRGVGEEEGEVVWERVETSQD